MQKQIEIFTDGSCLGNPGAGGIGIVLRYKQHEKQRSSKRLLQFADRHNIWPDAGFKADKITAKSFLTALNAAIINQTTMADISQLKLPITILSGKLDPLIVERNLKQLAKEHKNIDHRSMTMQSHEITDKYAERLSGIIKQHLTRELPLKSARRINRFGK